MRLFRVVASLLLLSMPLQAAIIKTPLYVYLDGEVVGERLKFKGKDTYKTVIELEKGSYQLMISDEANSCDWQLGASEPESKLRFGKELPLVTCASESYLLKVVLPGEYEVSMIKQNDQFVLNAKRFSKPVTEFKRQPPAVSCPAWDGQAVNVDVSSVFADGTLIREAYSQQTVRVENGQVSMMPAKDSGGLMMFEAVEASEQAFDWKSATVYFAVTDRFANGRSDNDESFGRHKDDGKLNAATFHGGDIAGVIEKLDYIEAMGADAIWLTPLFEQVRGFIDGAQGEYPFYSYHGYWIRDFTRLDPNFGTEEELRTLVAEAHKRGIRILMDVVLNHVGYETLADIQASQLDVMLPGAIEQLPANWNDWKPAAGGDWDDWRDLVDWQSANWDQWWGPEWVRAALPGYHKPGSDDYKLALAGLPDFVTEDESAKTLPPFLAKKADTGAVELSDADIIDYLVDWTSYWVREFGIDGFRADTAKHIETEHWSQLKASASAALAEWRAENPEDALQADTPFWMVAEAYGHGVYKDHYFDHGFDAVINFAYQEDVLKHAQCMSLAESDYAHYATKMAEQDFELLSYISSHDTSLFWASYQDIELQKGAGSAFAFLPGAIQIYYGDESGRDHSDTGGDFHHGTRSDMNWNELTGVKAPLLAHWQKVMNFRSQHPAIGAGVHQMISESPYVFSRVKGDDKVVIVYAGRQ